MLKKPETDRIFIGAFIMSRDFISFHAFRLVNRTENPMTQETECLIMCAYVHIGVPFKVRWRIETNLCTFLKQ